MTLTLQPPTLPEQPSSNRLPSEHHLLPELSPSRLHKPPFHKYKTPQLPKPSYLTRTTNPDPVETNHPHHTCTNPRMVDLCPFPRRILRCWPAHPGSSDAPEETTKNDDSGSNRNTARGRRRRKRRGGRATRRGAPKRWAGGVALPPNNADRPGLE